MCLNKGSKRDKSNTPVRTTSGDDTASDILACDREVIVGGSKITGRSSPTVADATVEPNELSSLTSIIKLLREDIADMKTHMTTLTDHVKQCFSRIDEQDKKIADSESRLRSLEDREREVIMCQNAITELRHELTTRAQFNLRNEIEISGIYESPNENPMHVVQVISQKIGVPFEANDLDYIIRVGPRNRDTETGVKNQDGSNYRPPRPLVIRFLRRHNREAFLKAGKIRRNLTCSDIGVEGGPRTIFINERLTQENRQLFRTARRLAKTAEYRYCWVKYGTVYVRRQEGNPAVPLRNMEEVQRHFNQTSG